MKISKNKTATTIAILLMLSISVSMILSPNVLGQVYLPAGTHIPTYARINVAPNPVGVGQTVNVNFFLASPLETSERPVNMTVVETDPDGKVTTLGPFTGDTTGGTFYNFVPSAPGNYTFQFKYLGQVLSGTPGPRSWAGLINDPSESKVATLVVQQEPITHTNYPFTPLPTNYWETPVSAENVQNWYKIMGPWLGLSSGQSAQTGGYSYNSVWNPYTESVYSGHILWTKVWCEGGVVGGEAGGTEDTGHYWSTRQYQAQFAPVIINGIIYSTWYPETMGYSAGILATDLYTGETLWRINTTNALRCGMDTRYKHINQYGAIGPFIWTTGTLPAADTGGIKINNTGTEWNMYSALTGQYVLSIVNGTGVQFRADENGNLIGYFINSTLGKQIVHPIPGVDQVVNINGPKLSCFNMTYAIGQTGGSWQPSLNTVRDFATGIMWSVPVPTNISGVPIDPALAINGITANAVVMSGGYIHGQGVGGETAGWLVVASMDQDTGAVLWLQNLTYPSTMSLLPYTRTTSTFTTMETHENGVIAIANDINYAVDAFDVRTGATLWKTTLKTDSGDGTPNNYDQFSLKSWVANGVMYWYGLGGDIWALNPLNGNLLWYTNTTKLLGDPGVETPYGIWPLWVFNSNCYTNDVSYFTIGHEYNPPLFHGAQLLALNATNGELIWKELDMSIRSTTIAYGKMLSINAYDNQIYCFGKGPSATTVTAPNVGVTTNTPITITGTVMDVSAGKDQGEVARNFPTGLPAISDESQSKWMEHVYQDQPMPSDATGVPVTLSVIDSNNNYRQIGTTTSSAMGTYGFTWTPDIPGNYTVYASFAGSNSYYPSSAETYFYASSPQATTTAAAQTNLATSDLVNNLVIYVIAGVIAIIVVIIIGFALVLRKRS